jgi:hypothetical protein
VRGSGPAALLCSLQFVFEPALVAPPRHARIIRSDQFSGKRTEIPVNLKKILAGKAPDPRLHSRDILFVPNTTGKAVLYPGAEAALSVAGGVIVYRR